MEIRTRDIATTDRIESSFSDMPYLRAANGERLAVPPVWLMRQAGRYLPEYNEIRRRHDFLAVCNTPELACEVTLQPIRRFGFDAAILFSDILVPLVPMGANLRFDKGHGPQIDNPVRTAAEVDKLRRIQPREDLPQVLEAIRLIRSKLPAQTALLGFAGAPFTLAAYWVEGGKPQPFANLMRLVYGDRPTFKSLMKKLADMVANYLTAMIESGANAIQLFDTWAGVLSESQFREINLPFVREIFDRLSSKQVPMTYFVHGGMHLLAAIKETGCSVVSLDWRTPFDEARSMMGPSISLQGNLDPTVLLGGEEMIRGEVRRVVDEGNQRGGYIFNLGHGILPTTPIDSVHVMLDEIRNGRSQK